MRTSLAEVGKDLTAGTMAGVAQLLVGHPFDTVKVKLQSQVAAQPGQPLKYAGALDAVKKIITIEGPRGLYRGFGAPLATVALFNAVLFTARGQMEAMLLLHNKRLDTQLTIRQQMVAGAGAGMAVSFVACPTELVKCRLQAQSELNNLVIPAVSRNEEIASSNVVHQITESKKVNVVDPRNLSPGPERVGGLKTMVAGAPNNSENGGYRNVQDEERGNNFDDLEAPCGVVASLQDSAGVGARKYDGSLDVAKHIFRCEGGWLGFFKGLTPTLLREVFGNAAYFGAYQGTKQLISGGQFSKLGMGPQLVAGGVAGAMFWLFVYPADVIKSMIQVDDHQNPKYKNTFDALKKVYAAEGVKGLYRGFGPAMARSVPANAACFLVYDLVRKGLN